MGNKSYKYATEAGLTFRLDRFIMCQREEFPKYEASPYHFQFLESCNLYIICRRPRITVLPNSLNVTEQIIQLTFQYWEGNQKYDFPIVFANETGSTNLRIVSEYPHSSFTILDESNNEVYSAKASYVADDMRPGIFPNPAFLDLEILYIGKALDHSKKPTFNRLIRHETFSEILSENPPDKEVFLLLCPLFINGDIEIRGTINTQKEFEKEDKRRLKRFMKTRLAITHEQQVAVAEAALIKYFQPPYNEHHKNTFPTKRNPSYDELYKMDFNTVTIEVDTTEIETMPYFFTGKVTSSQSHSHSFFLPTEADRRKLFDY